MEIILTCNAGSTNTKLALYDHKSLNKIDHIVAKSNEEVIRWLEHIQVEKIKAVGHRIVHGGKNFTHPVIISEQIWKELNTLIPLAPLHQPAALQLVIETQKILSKVPHIACFDTAFHHTNNNIEKRLPLSEDFHSQGILRYGFHGLSYQYISSIIKNHVQEKNIRRIVVAHLGGGSSACAMKDLQSVATTMGFSTLDGLMMGTRPGAIDSGVILYLLQEKSLSVEEVTDLLYNKSGLLGVSGISSNMQELLSLHQHPNAQIAIDLYCLSAAKQIASLLPSLGGMEALIFTGGIGENAAPIRNKILERLEWLPQFQNLVISTDEEFVIAKSCQKLI